MKKYIINLISISKIFKIPELSIQPIAPDQDIIIEMCTIRKGKNKGKIDLKKLAKIYSYLSEANMKSVPNMWRRIL